MKIPEITLAKIAWPVVLVAVFFIGRGFAPRSQDSGAAPDASGASAPKSSAQTDVEGAVMELRGSRAGPGPVDEIEEIANLEDPVQRMRRLIAFMDRLGPYEFAAVVAAYRELGTPSMADYQMLLTGWARVNPLAAVAFLKGLESGGPSGWMAVLRSWALDDPDAAIDWTTENIGDDKASWLAEMIGQRAGTDLDSATSLIYRLPESLREKETKESLNAIVATLAKQEPAIMTSWVSGLPEGPLRAGAARRVAMRLAATDPREVVLWAETLDSESRRQAYEELTQPWALRAPEDALGWAGTLEGETLHQVAERIAPAVAAKNPQMAGEWLARFDGDPGLDPARLRLANQLSRKNPELSADWIGRITDVATGERELQRLLNGWLERDPDAARRFLEAR